MGWLNLSDIPFAQMRRLPTPTEIRLADDDYASFLSGNLCVKLCLWCGSKLTATPSRSQVVLESQTYRSDLLLAINCNVCTFSVVMNNLGQSINSIAA